MLHARAGMYRPTPPVVARRAPRLTYNVSTLQKSCARRGPRLQRLTNLLLRRIRNPRTAAASAALAAPSRRVVRRGGDGRHR